MVARFRANAKLVSGDPARPGDTLLLISRANQWDVASEAGLESGLDNSQPGAVTARVVVGHGSTLIGEGYEAVGTRSFGEVAVVAGGPRAARLRQPLDTIRIEAGDQLFLRGPAEAIAALLPKARLLEVDRFDPAPLDRRRGALTLLIFVSAVAATVAGLMPAALSFLLPPSPSRRSGCFRPRKSISRSIGA